MIKEINNRLTRFLESMYAVLIFLKTSLAKRIEKLRNRRRIKFSFNPSLSTWHTIHNLLSTMVSEGKGGFVAQHLVGAKLQLRFKDITISNESASTADLQTNRPGNFLIGSTAFHITVAPMPPVFDKCKHNISQGLKPFLLVPDNKLIGARQNAEQIIEQQIAVESIESFVSQNIDEISAFNKDNLILSIKELVSIYNTRVDEVETDKSLMIELPSNLQ